MQQLNQRYCIVRKICISDDNFSVCNLHLRGDGPTYMECIFEEKMEIVQEMVDREAGQFWCWLL